MKWQTDRGKGFIVIAPPDSGFSKYVRQKKLQGDRIKNVTGGLCLDMKNYCRCNTAIRDLYWYYNQEEDFDFNEPKYAINSDGKLWDDPQWKVLPSRLCSLVAFFTQLVSLKGMRQNFLVEDLLEHFDDGTLCGASMFLDRGAECSCLLQDMQHVITTLPVPLKHILPQKFTAPLLVHTLRKIDQLPMSTEASVRESADQRITELIPGLQIVRRKTLPQMYFESCSVSEERMDVSTLCFNILKMVLYSFGNLVITIMCIHVCVTVVSTSKPFSIHDWSTIVFSNEPIGAIKRGVEDPPTIYTPPDGDGRMHPDTHGAVPLDEPDENTPEDDPLDDDNQPGYPAGQDPEDDDPNEEYIIPDDHGPPPEDDMGMPGVAQEPGETPDQGFQPQRFSNPDVPMEEITAPDDDDPSPGNDPTSEPIRAQRKKRICCEYAQQEPQQNSQGTEELISSNDVDETEPCNTDDTPVLTEEEIAQLQEEDVDTEPYQSDHSHFVDFDGTVFVSLGPKLNAAPDFGSYDVTGFKHFEQYLAKNGKKQPKAESVITQKVLRKYAQEIKQAKLEEFRSFLDFTAMTFRDKRRHKIDNYVTGRWVLTIKVDKDGQFKKFKARWVCRGFQDAQKFDFQTDSPTAHLSMPPRCCGIHSNWT
eukprot:s2970_g18.t1